MGIHPDGDYAVLRFSFGPSTTESDIDTAAAAVAEITGRLRDARP
jgi:cysteine sulfinate desulfinase/cysteine desulfurase-like protein